MTRRLISTALVILFAGCSSGPVRDPLPFHVAVIPVGARQEFSGAEDPGDDEGFALRIDEAQVSQRLVEVLGETSFVRATLLAFPDDVDRETFRGHSLQNRESHWIRAAQEIRADFVLRTTLLFRPEIEHRINTGFWLNLPIYLFLGPVSFFVPDRSYYLDLEVTALLYDFHSLGRSTTLGDDRDSLMQIYSELPEVPLNLVKRAGRNPWKYLFSLVIPPGVVARQNDEVLESLRHAIAERVSESISDRILAGSLILRTGSGTRFYIPEDTVRAEWRDGAVQIEADVIFRWGSGIERMDGYVLNCGGASQRTAFGQGEIIDEVERIYRYPIRATLQEAAAGARWVQIIATDAGTSGNTRSFTFPVHAEGELPDRSRSKDQ